MRLLLKRMFIIICCLVICIFIFMIYSVNKNNGYMANMLSIIKDNYEIKDTIEYYNKSNDNYVLLVNNKLIVLNDTFEEIFKEDVNNMYEWSTKYDIVYKNDTPMYEWKKNSNKKIIYHYYDIYDGELIEQIEIEG